MPIRRLLIVPLAVLAVSLLPTGCALSPQSVQVQPVLDVAVPALGRNRPLALEVVDQRPTPQFGARGGVYTTALISPAGDVAAAVRRALAERLGAAQFQVLPTPAEAPLGLRVEILRVDYRASGEPVVTEVRASAEVRALARNGTRSFTGQYRANSARQVVGPPGDADNQAIINEIITQALQRMLADQGLLDALSR